MWVLLFSVLKLEQTLLKSMLATALRSSMECKTVRFFKIKCNCASHKCLELYSLSCRFCAAALKK